MNDCCVLNSMFYIIDIARRFIWVFFVILLLLIHNPSSIFAQNIQSRLFSKNAKVITVSTLSIFEDVMPLIGRKDIIFIDVDHCITTLKSNFFRGNSKERLLIQTITKAAKKRPYYLKPLESFYINAQYILVDDDWPIIIKQLLERTPNVFLLSRKTPGSFLSIRNMEALEYWRLGLLGIPTTQLLLNNQEYIKLNYTSVNDYTSVYYQGLILMGNISPSVILRDIMYLQDMIPQKILYISQYDKSLKDVLYAARALRIPYQGIKYQGEAKIKGNINPKMIQLQKRILLEKDRWLEDNQLQQIIDNQQAKLRDEK